MSTPARRSIIATVVGGLVFLLVNIFGIDLPVSFGAQTVDVVDGAVSLGTVLVAAFQAGKARALKSA
jgi:uncharacterized protein (DUF697 family)